MKSLLSQNRRPQARRAASGVRSRLSRVWRSPRRISRVWWALLTLGIVGAWELATACDTPVYRYAMYRWEATPYEVFGFHNGPLDEATARLHRLLQAAQTSADKPANISLLTVDLSKDAELKTIPAPVREAWKKLKEPQTPFYLLYSPLGRQLLAGKLDETQVQTLLGSPVRDNLAQQLAEGKAAVLLLLTSTDEKANAEAEKTIGEVLKDVAAGKIALYSPPPPLPPAAEKPEKSEKPEAGPKLAVGFIKISRQDAKERWLVDSLLSLEEDLKSEQFAAQPLVFPIFGRGRVLPPCVGKGIVRDNLLACIDFVTGACSCTVKDQNPGMDLLMACDWNGVAEKLATRFGAEEGNEAHVGTAGLFPQLMIPSVPGVPAAEKPAASQAKPDAPPADNSSAAQKTTAAAASPKPAPSQTPAPGKPQAAEVQPEPSDPEATPAPEADSTAADAPAAADSDVAAGDAFSSVFAVGAGLAVALVVLFGLTFFILRPR